MSALTPQQLAFLSAALRHARDARHLCAAHEHRSIEQAWHLAGFAPECARKALLPNAWAHRLLGHEVSEDAHACLRWLLTLDPSNGCYPVFDVEVEGLDRWAPESRYDATGQLREKKPPGGEASRLTARDVEALAASADAYVMQIVTLLWLDGRIKELV